MQFELTATVSRPMRTISRAAGCSLAAINTEATRLRSWALTSGERVTGLPFLRLPGPDRCTVHIPVEGRVIPHPQAGIDREDAGEQRCVSLRVVRFQDLRGILRELSDEIAVDCGLAGAPEFHPASAAFTTGTILWPVHRYPFSTSTIFTVGGPARAELVS